MSATNGTGPREAVPSPEQLRRAAIVDSSDDAITRTLSPLKDAAGLIIGVSAIACDITRRQQAQELLTLSEARFRRLFETAQDGILILNAKTGSITEANPFLAALTGYAPEELLGKKLWEIGPFKDIERSKTAFHELQTKSYIRYDNLPLQARDGRRLEVEFVSNAYQVGETRVIQCNIRDITDRKRTEHALHDAKERLERLILLDPLTELLNRRGLQQALSQEMQRARRESSTLCALLADVDDFKQINDGFGMTVGDGTLVQIARQLKASTRATDHVARIGGDEFLILLPGTRLAEGMRIADKLRLVIAGTTVTPTPTSILAVTASFGLVQVSEAMTSIERLLSHAQVALRRSKQAGKNHVSSHAPLGATYRQGLLFGRPV